MGSACCCCCASSPADTTDVSAHDNRDDEQHDEQEGGGDDSHANESAATVAPVECGNADGDNEPNGTNKNDNKEGDSAEQELLRQQQQQEERQRRADAEADKEEARRKAEAKAAEEAAAEAQRRRREQELLLLAQQQTAATRSGNSSVGRGHKDDYVNDDDGTVMEDVDAACAPPDHNAVHELFESVTKNKPALWSSANPLAKWPGVTLDSRGNVIEIVAENTDMRGSLSKKVLANLSERLPLLRVLILDGHQLCCDVDLTNLPPQLETLALACQRGIGLRGTFDFARAPRSLQHLNLSHNSLKLRNFGSVSQLDSLELLCLERCEFLDFGVLGPLPASLRSFSIQLSKFNNNARIDMATLFARSRSLTQLYLHVTIGLTLYCSDVTKLRQFPVKLLSADSKLSLNDRVFVMMPPSEDGGEEMRVTAAQMFQKASKS